MGGRDEWYKLLDVYLQSVRTEHENKWNKNEGKEMNCHICNT